VTGGYHSYLIWRRLSHNGRRTRKDLSPAQQAEWDAAGITESSFWPEIDQEEARRLYEEATR
jgi:hypothetical protein